MTSTPRRPRIAYFSYSTGEFDSRTRRMAGSAMAEGYDVVMYARLEPGLPRREVVDGLQIIRAPFDWRLAFGPTRSAGRRRAEVAVAAGADRGDASDTEGQSALGAAGRAAGSAGERPGPARRRLVTRALGAIDRIVFAYAFHKARLFPVRPSAWSVALDEVVEPADVWHGMWAGSLPALARFKRRYGGRTIYDSRDIFLHARSFEQAPRLLKALFRAFERRWARAADAVITVNDEYARILRETLGVRAAAIVRNCPERFTPPEPRPDLIRERLGLAASTRIVLYQGNLMTERGIEEGMEAILEVPDAVLILLGYGGLRNQLAAAVAEPPFAGRVFLIDAVPPSELLDWTASADILLMAIQPTTLNHQFTTPNKLWEGLAAGVPIVASDLPGMAEVIAESGAGVVCDPTRPAAIAEAIRALLALPKEELAAYGRRGLAAAHARYNWETQVAGLLGLYRDLLTSSSVVSAVPVAAAEAPAPSIDARTPRANASDSESGS